MWIKEDEFKKLKARIDALATEVSELRMNASVYAGTHGAAYVNQGSGSFYYPGETVTLSIRDAFSMLLTKLNLRLTVASVAYQKAGAVIEDVKTIKVEAP
jgi:hypothetical protein